MISLDTKVRERLLARLLTKVLLNQLETQRHPATKIGDANMKSIILKLILPAIIFSLLTFLSNSSFAQSTLNCQQCHPTEKTKWLSSRHANTQTDLASELSANWVGQTPDSVINGSQAEDCVACHSPLAVTVNGGMTETQAMGYFFTTDANGKYTSSTDTTHSSQWPNVYCTTCHNVPSNHPSTMPVLSAFNSQTAKYDTTQKASVLCGQCHGSLHFAGTDHRTYDAWLMSRHSHRGQNDVAGELAANDTGMTPLQIVSQEDCIGCHAPTSVIVQTSNGPSTISEAQALSNFFTTSGGMITASTVPQDTADFPNVACNACHDPHNPGVPSYFNSSTGQYQVMNSPDSLCGQCHGNLRFAGTDHISYNFLRGEGGTGVQSQVTMQGQPTCIDCHMYKSNIDGTNSKMYGGHSWSVFIKEPDGTTTASCTTCHSTMTADSAMAVVTSWKNQFAQLDSTAQADIALADTFVAKHSSDSLKNAYLAEAIQNTTVSENDESGGFHNHNYSVALLNDAIAKATFIITGILQKPPEVPLHFSLLQNYPNPFNPTTEIEFQIPKNAVVTLKVYDILGSVVSTLIDNQKMNAGEHKVVFNGDNLSSGVYLYRLATPGFTQTKKMILIK